MRAVRFRGREIAYGDTAKCFLAFQHRFHRGATVEFGFAAVENRVHMHDLHAIDLDLMGFDHEKFTHRYAGRDFRLTDVHGRVAKELIA